MALKALLNKEEHGKLSPALQSEYTEKDGKFFLDVIPVEGLVLENVTGLKSALSKERSDREEAQRQLTAFADIDPKKAREAMQKVDSMKDWKPEDKVREQIEAREKALNDKWTKEVDTRDQSIKSLTGQLETNLVDSAAVTAISKAKGRVNLLLPHVKSSVRMTKDSNGNYRAQVVDANGQPRITQRSGSMDPMTIDELVESMKGVEEYSVAFEGNGASGGGAGNNGGGGGGAGRSSTVKWNDQDALNSNIDDIASGKVRVVQ